MKLVLAKLKRFQKQEEYFNSSARFIVTACGRRTGKTLISRRKALRRVLRSRLGGRYFAFTAPTQQQAKRLFWNQLKRLVTPNLRLGNPSETELVIPLVTGNYIIVAGLDKPERLEGIPIGGIVIDEFGDCKPTVWQEHLRASLADSNGWCFFTGTPEGRNHYYDMYRKAQQENKKGNPIWDCFHWTSEEVLPIYGKEDELEQAKHDLDPQTYEQEFLANFLNFAGRIYYGWDSEQNVKRCRYQKGVPLHFMFDFNVSPGIAIVGQDTPQETKIIDEVWIKDNSNTEKICDVLIDRYSEHKGPVWCYGDATGGARGTAKIRGSDWDLIKGKLEPVFSSRLGFRVPNSNPAERRRINATNSRIKSASGVRSFFVDPHCTHTIDEFEGVIAKEGGTGEKDKDPRKFKYLTHISDAVDYFMDKEHPIVRSDLYVRYI